MQSNPQAGQQRCNTNICQSHPTRIQRCNKVKVCLCKTDLERLYQKASKFSWLWVQTNSDGEEVRVIFWSIGTHNRCTQPAQLQSTSIHQVQFIPSQSRRSTYATQLVARMCRAFSFPMVAGSVFRRNLAQRQQNTDQQPRCANSGSSLHGQRKICERVADTGILANPLRTAAPTTQFCQRRIHPAALATMASYRRYGSGQRQDVQCGAARTTTTTVRGTACFG